MAGSFSEITSVSSSFLHRYLLWGCDLLLLFQAIFLLPSSFPHCSSSSITTTAEFGHAWLVMQVGGSTESWPRLEDCW